LPSWCPIRLVATFHESTGRPHFDQNCTTLVVGKHMIFPGEVLWHSMCLILRRAAIASERNQPWRSVIASATRQAAGLLGRMGFPRSQAGPRPCRVSGIPTGRPNNIPATPCQPLAPPMPSVVLVCRILTSLARLAYFSTFAGDNLCKMICKGYKKSVSAVCSADRQL